MKSFKTFRFITLPLRFPALLDSLCNDREFLFMEEFEIWMPVKGYEGKYEVSHFGNVRSLLRCRGVLGRILKPGRSCNSLSVALLNNGKQKSFLVHILVLQAFHSLRPNGLEGCHNDGNYRNNYIGNLRWDTHKNNMQDSIRHGTFNFMKGENHQLSKLKNSDVSEIKRLLSFGLKPSIIAENFGVKPTTIYSIMSGKQWKHIHDKI